MGDPKRLQVWLGRSGSVGSAPRPSGELPTLAQAGYSPPNPDRTRQMCRNCYLWLSAHVECSIHDPSLLVPNDANCRFHVFGAPQDKLPDEARLLRQSLTFVNPEYSGLQQVADGPSCDRCEHFSPQGATGGTCRKTRDETDPTLSAVVEALGKCNFFDLM